MLSAGSTIFSRGVSASVTGTDLASTVTVGATCTSIWRAHVRNAASVSPFPSNVLHSTEDAVTNILVPGLTVQDSTPVGSGVNGARVPPRSKHANAAPPVPKGFWALGI
jgi:hypothetical protein